MWPRGRGSEGEGQWPQNLEKERERADYDELVVASEEQVLPFAKVTVTIK